MMKSLIRSILLSFLFVASNARSLPSQGEYAAPIMAGISNHGQNGARAYVTAGDRAYLIGTQDGNFPDMGEHLPGEMGGLWLHPIKLIDGFWAEVTDVATNQRVALSKSAEFVNYPYGNRFKYAPVLDSLEIERFQFSPDSQPGVIVQYTFKNATLRRRTADRTPIADSHARSGSHGCIELQRRRRNQALPDDVLVRLELLEDNRFRNGVVHLHYRTRK